jgi:8-oxo-dGTP diphosphatase
MPDIELAAAIVVHRSHVLIVQRSQSETFLPGVWGVPCGKVNIDERSAEAVLRELHEETGLNGDVLHLVGYSEFASNWRGRRVRNLQCNYLVRARIDPADTDSADMPQVRPPKVDQESKWVHTDKIDSAGLDEHNLRTIRQGLGVRMPADALFVPVGALAGILTT